MIAAIITIPLFFLFKMYRKLSKWMLFLVLFMIITGSVVLIATNARIKYSLEDISKNNVSETAKENVRILIWKSAIGVIKQNLAFGVGTGDASEELKKEFRSRGYVDGFYDNLNAHNQFLEILLENGLTGLILFIGIIGYISYIAISKQNLLLGLFLVIMLVFFMFETVLNRLAGITFFPLITFLLIHVKRKTQTSQ
jgi:O-antigen ligase